MKKILRVTYRLDKRDHAHKEQFRSLIAKGLKSEPNESEFFRAIFWALSADKKLSSLLASAVVELLTRQV